MKNHLILIVDDDQNIRDILAQLLLYNNYKVIEARNGREGFDRIKENNPDLAITDYEMPNMDGLELIRAVRAEKKYNNIPIFFMSGILDDILATDAKKAGANEFMNKPLDLVKLIQKIKKWLP
ncbi:hypothetical protein CO115_03665 [Candidatus Falkowbacteria bacterium CG_4_9_14_3_um_filter_36_9]|uniref:Response regulatory domain-containing protein n=1 Tax=Candidatus Falkowbacteria bacterium CG02_land_8_20_14_3_00_36_14 TaxID=1974560 RepID=A0A2M7DMD2_9BACT|nr:MAG: hypothetical protein COS18_03700 [Candidatus Falkowbacteria bacterium CG02_land_8_20_14_3_00_36_14]PIX11645.1 MAG: hypothetical protein COZ73_02075 [Candidatus Falkowbacteria bacterium CG_4_8_14_3_um_filter_36_11]PJA11091.1 MAG: hypothetical protein COX67_01605 [Candidatus Falkowbacteria bacterium CG_4_10_14_0_2_um_filter_36_22]PJB18858.1 MAG: hypothetical protein CO115_03665 [Candidatus Falkowbacteria bacterium CG_4_9_14_3_um_filter_36_9]